MYTTTNPTTTPATEAELTRSLALEAETSGEMNLRPLPRFRDEKGAPLVYICAEGCPGPESVVPMFRDRYMKYCAFAFVKNRLPLAPGMMELFRRDDDGYSIDGLYGTMIEQVSLECMVRCDEIWVFTRDNKLTYDMEWRLEGARKLHIPVRYFDAKEVEDFIDERYC